MIFERTAWRLRASVAFLCFACAIAAACGGSGSSGFDGEPAGEPEALTQAVEEGTCVAFEGVTYCGSGAAFDVEGDFASVEIDESSMPVTCAQSSEEVCEASVAFTPVGFPAGTIFLVASAASFEGPWTLSASTPPPSTGGPPEDRSAEVQLPTSGGGSAPPTPLIIAVLVYLDVPAGELPDQAPLISEFGPDVVYASRELEVAPGS